MSETKLGKIQHCYFGRSGYQDAMMGAVFTLGSDQESWGVVDHITGGWAIKRSQGAKWTEEDRLKSHGEMVVSLTILMEEAKVKSFDELKGKPVEVVFGEMGKLEEWRILKEVI